MQLCNGASETHFLAAERQKKNEKFKQALGIDEDYVEGSAFNSNYQEMQKQKRKVCLNFNMMGSTGCMMHLSSGVFYA